MHSASSNNYWFLKLLLNSFELNGLCYAITGDSSGFEAEIKSDVDLLVTCGSNDQINRVIVDSLKQHNVYLANYVEHRNGICYTFRWLKHNGCFVTLSLDLCTAISFAGIEYLGAQPLLSRRVRCPFTTLFTLNTTDQFESYLIKKKYKNSISLTQLEYLKILISSPEFDVECLSSTFEREKLKDFIFALQDADDVGSPKVIRQFNLLSLSHNIDVRTRLKSVFAEFWRLCRRVKSPAGFTIVILGPDGCGKSTAIGSVIDSWNLVFRSVKTFHLLPYLTENRSVPKIISNPHEQNPRNLFGSILKLFYFVGYYNLGYLLRVLPRKIRAQLTIFDRYFHDILVDPRRYRQSESNQITRIFAKWIPQPDLWLLLNASPSTIQNRKQEVSFEESQRQCAAYLSLFSELGNANVIDAEQTVSKVSIDINMAILNVLNNKALSRIG